MLSRKPEPVVIDIRPMRPADVAAAAPIFAAVGWGDHSPQLHFFIARPGSALFVADAPLHRLARAVTWVRCKLRRIPVDDQLAVGAR